MVLPGAGRKHFGLCRTEPEHERAVFSGAGGDRRRQNKIPLSSAEQIGARQPAGGSELQRQGVLNLFRGAGESRSAPPGDAFAERDERVVEDFIGGGPTQSIANWGSFR